MPEGAILLSERRFLPRQMDFESLIKLLTEEHRVMEAGFVRIKEAATKGDFGGVAAALDELDSVFRQHIADEESQILRLLIGELGVGGAEAEIRVFQQHRPIHRLMQLVAELASKSSTELADNQSRLNDLFLEHTSLEEEGVFPRAMAACGEHRRRQATNPPS